MADPIARDVLTGKVYERLRDGILQNRIPQGARINLGQLAREFQTSNTPLRHALARLESEGLVVSNAYRGFEVAPALDAKSVEDLYEIRGLIEPATARRAAANASSDHLAVLSDAFSAYEATADPDGRYSADLSQRDLEFHSAVARCSGNEQVVPILTRIMVSMRVFDDKVRPEAVSQTVDEHRAVMEAVRRGDPAGAEVAMATHLRASRDRWEQNARS